MRPRRPPPTISYSRAGSGAALGRHLVSGDGPSEDGGGEEGRRSRLRRERGWWWARGGSWSGTPSPTVMDAVGVGSIGLSCAGRRWLLTRRGGEGYERRQWEEPKGKRHG
ncbi:hypothetical protein DAI22_10g122400 [Oryza sativa Japonica Group]|uniref:Uncharacterized protein n=1 Tax=Oryza sativa subsp. japonica TaxID=39947 RepID=Q8LNQ1_ORYSJ|nr:hypothetical protein [Oryza sativa Japonica Group]KAF2913898.1 hypothetical protein DAI22_10g122400 [Oryza sativa Japonica Group]